MNITTSHLPTFCKTLETAIADNKNWVCYDNSIPQISAYDLHFFGSSGQAADFQLFNEHYDKEVALLPTEALLQYLRETNANLLLEGKPFTQILFEDLDVLAMQYEYKFSLTASDLESLMDAYNWKEVMYQPQEDGVKGEKIQLEYLMEQLSRFSASGEKEKAFVGELVDRHWKGQPMKAFVREVVNGQFHLRQFNHQHKTESMTQENLEYLQKQLKYADFGEELYAPLERAMKEGKEGFQLETSQLFGKDQMSAVLHFARSKQEGSDMYFFNRYDATLTGQNLNASSTFWINNKGQSVGLREAGNLLNGRSVYKEVTPKVGDSYKAWITLNFSDRDEHGNPKMQYYNYGYGFDLKEAIGRLNLKEFSDPEKLENLYTSLQKGNLTDATLVKGAKEIPVQLATDPKYKTMKMYDMEGSKLYMPGPKQETRYGNAPVDDKRKANDNILQVGDLLADSVKNQGKGFALTGGQENGQHMGVGQEVQNKGLASVEQPDKKKDLLAKKTPDNNLMPKNRVNRKQGRSIS